MYEDLIDDLARVDGAGNFPADTKVLRQIAAFLGVTNRFHYNGYLRKVINKPYAELIENLDELIEGLARSEFAEFAPSLISTQRTRIGFTEPEIVSRNIPKRLWKGVRILFDSFRPVTDN